MTLLGPLLLAAFALLATNVSSQHSSKAVINFCDPDVEKSCGAGVCEKKRSGSRCKCPTGFMGRGCTRPCQDIYKSCTRWKNENRCHWARPISPFFFDNCPLSCGICTSDGTHLEIPLPPILDHIAWLTGRWETKTKAGDRFPEPISGGYKEILDVQLTDVAAFDRPGVNISVYAETLDGKDVHREVGFITGKPFLEDTGFVEFDKPATGDDLVAIELTSNTGITLIEEGVVEENSLRLAVAYQRSLIPDRNSLKFAKRTFILVAPGFLEERTVYQDKKGNEKKWLKRYKKIHDYLSDVRKD